MIYIVLFIGMFLEGIFSNLIAFQNSFFLPLFTLVTIVLLHSYLKGNLKKCIIVGFIYGLLYDCIYTQALFLDGFLFVCVILILQFLCQFVSCTMIGISFLLFFSICVYRIGSYIILCMIGYINFNVPFLFLAIQSSIILNLIYGILLFYVLKWYYKRHLLIF